MSFGGFKLKSDIAIDSESPKFCKQTNMLYGRFGKSYVLRSFGRSIGGSKLK